MRIPLHSGGGNRQQAGRIWIQSGAEVFCGDSAQRIGRVRPFAVAFALVPNQVSSRVKPG